MKRRDNSILFSFFSYNLCLVDNLLHASDLVAFNQHHFDAVRMIGAVRQQPLHMPSCQFPGALVFLQDDIDQSADLMFFLSFPSIFSSFLSKLFAQCDDVIDRFVQIVDRVLQRLIRFDVHAC